MPPVVYNRYSRYLHWLIAGLMIFTIALGLRLEHVDDRVFSRVSLHKSIGLLILLLTCCRIGLRLIFKAPAEVPMSVWQALAAKALHLGFYIVMIGLPLTGWLFVSTAPGNIPFFGLAWPHLPVPADKTLHDRLEAIHSLTALIVAFGMIPLHVLAALKHQFVDRDDVLEHMVPGLAPRPLLNWRWIVPLGTVGIAALLGSTIYRSTSTAARVEAAPAVDDDASGNPSSPFPATTQAPGTVPAPALAPTPATAIPSPSPLPSTTDAAADEKPDGQPVPQWTIDKAASTIGFATSYLGSPATGGFAGYDAAIRFDPSRLALSSVRVAIDLASEHSDSQERDESLAGPSFFDTARFAQSVYEAKRFTRKDDTHFIAHGTLSLHGVSRPLDLPFTLTIEKDRATVTGSATIKRLAYGVGSGDWAGTDAIPDAVTVTIRIKARKHP